MWLPQLGRAGTPYARDVENKNPLPANALPDPGLVFDTLLRAKPGDFQPHPGGNSSLTFAFASLVTHSLFRTRPGPDNWNINDTSSYLDLSVLYGVSDEQQDMVRNKAAGRGYLWKDAFAEDRLILVPPAATALLVIFSRNHNVSRLPRGTLHRANRKCSILQTRFSRSTSVDVGQTHRPRMPKNAPSRMRRYSRLLG